MDLSQAGTEIRSTHYVETFLDLVSAQASFPAGAGKAICGDVQGHVLGTMTMGMARGMAQVGGKPYEFKDQVLNVRGDFGFQENDINYPPKYDTGSSWIQGNSKGSIETLGLDYSPVVHIPPPDLPFSAPTLGLAALILLAIVWTVKNWAGLVGLLYARFGPERVLEHPRRQRVYEAVRQNPGADLSQLAAQVGCPINTVTYHVRVLRRTGKVGTLRHGKSVRVLPQEAMPARPTQLPKALLPHDPQMAFLTGLLAPGPRRIPEVVDVVMERFALSRRGALHVVARGVRTGLLVKEASPDGKRGKSAVVRCA